MYVGWLNFARKAVNSDFLFVQQKFNAKYEGVKYFSELNIMKILNVAEKNDAAKNISALLSNNGAKRREGLSKYNKIYEFQCEAFNQTCAMVMTSVSGHVLSLDFKHSIINKKWMSVDPISLFEEPIHKYCLPKDLQIKNNLQELVRSCNALIIWTDCDREGENIGFEIINICSEVKPGLQIYRAKFSEITYDSVKNALNNLQIPNKFLSEAVDVRRELDLRIGAAFTRFQTCFLKKKFPGAVDIQVISYGSCQFPTLGFVVERFKSIAEFIPELFWQINVQHTVDNIKVNFEWKRHRLFDKLACNVLYDKCVENGNACVDKVESTPKYKVRPKPLNTIDFEKIASKKLGINAKEALNIAENLYTQGLISYPRTETTIFPKDLKLEPLVEAQLVDDNWGDFARQILKDGLNPCQGNKSDQAHPPIHPIKYSNSLSGNHKRIYEFIVRHFLACLSKNAKGLETIVEIVIGEEGFVAKGLNITATNYLDVYPYERWNEKELPSYSKGDIFKPDISLHEGKTSPPELLTESDLLNLMEKYGIGTDATQAEHIDKIKSRLYVGLKDKKYFVPRTLGMALVESYNKIGYEVAKPKYRADLESDLQKITQNKISTSEVLSRHLKVYKEIYEGVQNHLDNFLSTLESYLQLVATDTQIKQNQNYSPVIKCKSCGSPMLLKKTRNEMFLVECSSFPQCRDVVRFPSSVTQVTNTHRECSRCGPGNYVLDITFQSGNPCTPQNYVGCIAGCDENLLNILRSCDTVVPNSSDCRNDNDSGFCTAPKSLPEVVSNDQPNCYCGKPAILLQVKKHGPHTKRYFYKCAKSEISMQCRFFKWQDDNSSTVVIPQGDSNETVRCYCAIPSKRLCAKQGPNKGREFYSCGMTVGSEDRCKFFKWADVKNPSSNESKTSTQKLQGCNNKQVLPNKNTKFRAKK